MPIREEADTIKTRIQALRDEIDIERLKLEIVRKRCKHSNRYLTTVMGDDTWRCPDCS